MYQYDSANPLRRVMRRSGEWPPMSWLYARTLHHLDRWVYRATRGRTTFVSWVTGLPVVLLTTTGAKSGRRHTLPLVAIPNEDRLIVIASNYGQRRNPAWYHNLKANPEVTLEVGKDKFKAKASIAEGAERDRLYAQQAAMMPAFNEYQEKTTRKIPVVVLERA